MIDAGLIFKIAAIGILIAVLDKIFKGMGREDQSTMITLAGLVIVLMMVLTLISKLFNSVRTMFQF